MRKFVLLLFLLIAIYSKGICQITSFNRDSIQKELIHTFLLKQHYVAIKKNRIANLKQYAINQIHTTEETYQINHMLAQEYTKLNSDSAIFYTCLNLDLAKKQNRNDLMCQSQIELASLYSMKGLYLEASSLLKSINRKKLAKQSLPLYYYSWLDFYKHYTQANRTDNYRQQQILYKDSLINLIGTEKSTDRLKYSDALIMDQPAQKTLLLLSELLKQTTDKNILRAQIAYFIGRILEKENKLDDALTYYMISAINDLKNANKDSASQFKLALLWFKQGNTNLSYQFMRSALDDYTYCNIGFRTAESSNFYPIINAAYHNKLQNQKNTLRLYLVILGILFICIIVFIIYIIIYVKKLAAVKQQLKQSNEKLNELNKHICSTNDRLLSTNTKLTESNKIKEEYITQFFDLCSSYIGQMEEFRKKLQINIKSNHINEALKVLRANTSLETEYVRLYQRFDTIFLSIYPNFINQFNALLKESERICPKQGEVLTTELRIYALVRLGIADSNKIASFLRYSPSTIYNYRTKIRHKAIGNDLDEQVMLISPEM